MKIWKFLLVALVLGSVIIAMVGCASNTTETTPSTMTATVSRGDVSIDITAAGNLALSHTEDLAIDLFYPAGTKGTVGEVFVEAGDSVSEGDVLVTVDRSEWDEQLSDLEDQVTTQERNLLQAQINVSTSEQNLKTAQATIETRETAILSAQISLQQAVDDLYGALQAVDDQAIIAEYYMARAWYDYATTVLGKSGGDDDDILLAIERAEDRLDAARLAYDNLLAGRSGQEAELKQQIEIAQRNLEAAETDLKNAQDAVQLSENSLTLNQGKLEDAEKALEDAKTKLAEAQIYSPEIKAPFDGFVTVVNVEGGDEVLNGTIAATVADPEKFEANILVSEIDIMQVQVGGRATVQADALPGAVFPAIVTHVSPTATIQSGVVNYNVKVEVGNPDSVNFTMSGTPSEYPNSGDGSVTLPPKLQQAVDEGRLTQEQAEEMMRSGPPEGFTPPEGITFPGGFGSQAQSQLSSGLDVQNAQLRDGLTVTVTISVAQAFDVLVVPNSAVMTQAGQSFVEVITGEGMTEMREVETGLSDWQYTEIVSGLTEGEQINVPRNVAPDSESEFRGFFGPPPR